MSNVNATPSPAAGVVALSLPDVLRQAAISRSTWYHLMQTGEAPLPGKIGKRSIWKKSEIDAWLEARFAAREVQP